MSKHGRPMKRKRFPPRWRTTICMCSEMRRTGNKKADFKEIAVFYDKSAILKNLPDRSGVYMYIRLRLN